MESLLTRQPSLRLSAHTAVMRGSRGPSRRSKTRPTTSRGWDWTVLGREVSSAWPVMRWVMLGARSAANSARTEKEARRWRAYLIVVDEGEPEEVVVYCPAAPSGSLRSVT